MGPGNTGGATSAGGPTSSSGAGSGGGGGGGGGWRARSIAAPMRAASCSRDVTGMTCPVRGSVNTPSKLGPAPGKNGGSRRPGMSNGTDHFLRIARSRAMWRFIAALPLRNFPGFRLGEEARELDLVERRRLRVGRDRAAVDLEPFRRRRRRPPPSEALDIAGNCANIQEFTTAAHLTLLPATLAWRRGRRQVHRRHARRRGCPTHVRTASAR